MSGRSKFHHHTLVMADGDPNKSLRSTLLPSQANKISDSLTVPRRGSMSLAVVRASACFPLNFHYTQDPTKRLTYVSQVDLKRIVAIERKSTDSGLKMAWISVIVNFNASRIKLCSAFIAFTVWRIFVVTNFINL